jgi:hypothetical protein
MTANGELCQAFAQSRLAGRQPGILGSRNFPLGHDSLRTTPITLAVMLDR